MFPTYEIKSYDIHSATCGQELINIHDGLKSPIAVGIYGYFLYGNSSYILEVYRKPQRYPYVVIDEKVPSTEPNEAEAKMKNAKASLSQIERKYKTAVKANSALSLLEILQLMFL
ncbi:unnamed protein product [Callosobruchus maculatus]|nr:unnamed protein product [Callosobruchus maculatus]